MKFNFVFLATLLIWLSACATNPRTIGTEDLDENSQADGGAFRVDAMQVRRPMPSHADWKPQEFYYKHCSPSSDVPFYSKTAYSCTDLY
jgi:hypothetical protein